MGLLYIACVYILAYYSEANKGGRAKVRLIRGGRLAIFLRIFVSRISQLA
uniref:Unclassified n=1 Tax=Fusarium culmorum CS7071 TaxID=1318462 RepID=A0A060QRD6_FUSCU|nr:unclassified [Fusarium culmorum CS7071]